MSTLYTDIYFKLVIDFSDIEGLSDYEVISGAAAHEAPPFDPTNPDEPWTHEVSNTVRFIRSLHFTDSSGSSSADPVGHMMSSNIYISVFDDEDTINPMNDSSDYAGHMTPGRKITVYKSTDRETWQPYFKGFVTNWQGSFNDGYYGDAQISASDALNNLGQLDVSDVAYAGSTALQALQAIFTSYGLTSADYVIDNSLGLSSLAYTALKSPARQTINDICYKSLARVTMKQDGKIYVEPIIIPAPVEADHILIPEDCGPVTPTNTDAVSYSKITVTYTAADGLVYQQLASQTDITLVNGISQIVLDTIGKVYSIESIDLTINEESAPQEYNSVTYTASEQSIVITVDAVLDNEKTATIKVYGLTAGGMQTKEVSANIEGSAIGSQAGTFTYQSTTIMDATSATALANSLASYIISLRRQIQIKQTSLSPDVEVGDTVELTGISSTYNGMYVVSKTDFEYSETVNMGLTLLKLS